MIMQSDIIYGYVYLIRNKINNKVYIGQTRRSITQRWWDHISQAFDPNKKHFYFHKAIDKYGKENFTIEEKYRAYSREELNEKEKYYIKIYRSTDSRYGYNLTEGGEHGQVTTVIQLDLEGKFLAYYPSISCASRESGCDISNIVACCTNRSLNFQWYYLDDLEERLDKPVKPKGQTNIPVIQMDLEGNIVKEWSSIKAANEALQIQNGEISAVCKGRRKTAKGFKWKYLYPTEELMKPCKHHSHRKVRQLTKDGEYIKTFNSVNEAALSIGQLKGGHISDVCKGRRSCCGGYRWEYVEE